MTERLVIIIMVALAAAFVVLLTKKWGIAEWYQVHGGDFLSKLFACDFCMSFWASVLIFASVAAVTGDVFYYVGPAISTPMTRMLV